jgi:hypothetical protein
VLGGALIQAESGRHGDVALRVPVEMEPNHVRLIHQRARHDGRALQQVDGLRGLEHLIPCHARARPHVKEYAEAGCLYAASGLGPLVVRSASYVSLLSQGSSRDGCVLYLGDLALYLGDALRGLGRQSQYSAQACPHPDEVVLACFEDVVLDCIEDVVLDRFQGIVADA